MRRMPATGFSHFDPRNGDEMIEDIFWTLLSLPLALIIAAFFRFDRKKLKAFAEEDLNKEIL